MVNTALSLQGLHYVPIAHRRSHVHPRLLYADGQGNILDHPGMGMAGSAGGRWEPVAENQCIPLPPGSELFLLPGRLPVGVDENGGFEVLERDPANGAAKVSAVAAFLAPAHTATLWSAFQTQAGAPVLPLFAYAAVGLSKERLVATAIRVDPLPRQDPDKFPPPQRLQEAGRRLLRKFRHNRLMQHLGHCAMGYGCPAARNLMLGRWEAPCPRPGPATPPAWAASPASPRAPSRSPRSASPSPPRWRRWWKWPCTTSAPPWTRW